MQDKTPYNENGQRQGYWEVTLRDDTRYKGNFAYDEPLGYFEIKWGRDNETEYRYYAR
jgi:hypothetical protein